MVVQNMSSMVQRCIRPVFDAAYCIVLLLRVKLPLTGILAMVGYGVFGVGVIKLLAPDFSHLTSEIQKLSAAFRRHPPDTPPAVVKHMVVRSLVPFLARRSSMSAPRLLPTDSRTPCVFAGSAHERVESAAESIAFQDGSASQRRHCSNLLTQPSACCTQLQKPAAEFGGGCIHLMSAWRGAGGVVEERCANSAANTVMKFLHKENTQSQ